MTNIYFRSLGCDKNLTDTRVMKSLCLEGGFALTASPENADVIVINTCAFIQSAVAESAGHITRLSAYKKNGAALIVAGCLPSRHKNAVLERFPEADAVICSNSHTKIAAVIKRVLSQRARVSLLTESPRNERLLENQAAGGHYAYLKIAEGCDSGCAYCVIPRIKGAYRSRSLDSLTREAENLARKGAKELILVAQDTALYGRDLCGKPLLAELLRRLAETSGAEWLRVMYAYPEHVTDALIAEMAENPKCCRYLDIPLQHASNRVLKLMGRRGSKDGIINLINKLRGKMPDITLRTTLMTGFPTESREDFAQLMDFVKAARFEKLGVFAYSRESGTAAARMKGQIPRHVKEQRREALMKAQAEISAELLRGKVGGALRVIVDKKTPKGYAGRASSDCPKVDGKVFFTSDEVLKPGDFASVNITGSTAYDLYGAAPARQREPSCL